MNKLLSFIKKEFTHILRDRRTLLIVIGMPITQLLLFGFAVSTEVKNVNVAVFDPSNDELTTKIIQRFDASKYFSIRERITSLDRINDIFREGKISLVMAFSDNFSEDAISGGAAEAGVQLIMDGTDPNQASLINAYATSILSDCRNEFAAANGSVSTTIVPTVKMLYNPQNKSSYNFVPGVMGLILMLICTIMTSIAIVREKEMGSMEVLLASPIHPIYIIIAKAIPYLVLSIIDVAIILLCAVNILDVPIAGSFLGLCGVSFLFLTCTLSLGLLISTLVKTQMSAMIASGIGQMMPTMLLSGLIYPIESMPKILQVVSNFVPARWYIQSVRMIMIQGSAVHYAMPEIRILALMTLVLLALTLKNFKTRLA